MCSRFPYPLEKGDKLRIYHQIRVLSKRHEIFLIALTDQDIPVHDLEMIETLVSKVRVYRRSKARRSMSLLRSIVSYLPFQVSYYYSKSIASDITREVDAWAPDHIFCQLARMSEYVRDLNYPKTLDYMDALGVGMNRRSEVVSGFMSMIYKIEAARMKRYERVIYPFFDHHTVISAQDAPLIHDAPISIVPNGIDTQAFSPMDLDKKYDIGFVGNMGYAPNIDAAEFLVNKILPMLPSDTTVVLAGARPDRRIQQLASARVTVTGWMDDVREAYAQSRVFVAPLWLGTGQQNKILEAMAMGIPCVTSAAVNNAIGARDGKEIYLADDAKEFARAISAILHNEVSSSEITKNALTFVREKYSWEKSAALLEELLTKESSKKQ